MQTPRLEEEGPFLGADWLVSGFRDGSTWECLRAAWAVARPQGISATAALQGPVGLVVRTGPQVT